MHNSQLPPAGEVYTAARPLILSTVRSFQRQHGGDFEELCSEANMYFIYAYRSYQAEKGPWPHWLRRVVWLTMLENARKKAKQSVYLQRAEMPTDVMDYRRQEHPINNLLTRLSPDSQTLVQLGIDRKLDSLQPEKCRKKLMNVLFDLGWSASRILESFGEIKEALLS